MGKVAEIEVEMFDFIFLSKVVLPPSRLETSLLI